MDSWISLAWRAPGLVALHLTLHAVPHRPGSCLLGSQNYQHQHSSCGLCLPWLCSFGRPPVELANPRVKGMLSSSCSPFSSTKNLTETNSDVPASTGSHFRSTGQQLKYNLKGISFYLILRQVTGGRQRQEFVNIRRFHLLGSELL